MIAVPRPWQAYALRAEVEHNRKDNDAALDDAKHALQLAPNDSSLHALLGVLQASNPSSPEAKSELEKAVSLDPKNASARIALAEVLNANGDSNGAEQQLRQAIAAAPTALQLRVALAALLHKNGDEAGVVKVFQDAANDLPDNEAATAMLKDYYLTQNKTADAKTAYSAILTGAKYTRNLYHFQPNFI